MPATPRPRRPPARRPAACAEANRLVGQLHPMQRRPAARGVALVEDQVQDVEHRAEALRASAGSGMAKGTPESRMRPFARLIRWAIVASGTRNARAISAVVRPPTARSVSGIADAGVSAGWQHRNRRRSESSSSATDDGDVPSGTATTCSRLHPGTIRPPRIDQPARGAAREPALRLLGDSRAGPPVGGRDQRLLDGVLRRVEIAVPAGECAKDPRRELAQQVLDLTRRVSVRPGGLGVLDHLLRRRRPLVHDPADVDGLLERNAAGTGHRGDARRDLEGTLLRLDIQDLVAGEPLLELGERAVGDDRRRRAIRSDDFARSGPVRTSPPVSSPFGFSSRLRVR